ncbi:hypothetical protein [Streptomyces sp. NBC_00299]|uniref:hypothetical protein n=1 Tax=Streptomyces sp. NBC_00299 TaxID=2975705 RepID=UPI002E29BC70|nr:hypothetical protein [Streptomyces sp. NBC_00299]
MLHDQNTDRTLLSTRAHNRLVRLRGYRILNRGGRTAYGATVALAANVRRARAGGSRYAHDARQQVRVWGNTLSEDGRAWTATGGQVSRAVSRRLPTRPTPATGPTGSSEPPVRTMPASSTRSGPPTSSPAGSTPAPAAPPASPTRLGGGQPRRPASPAGPVLAAGGGASNSTREAARARFEELKRRTEPAAERLRQQARAPQPPDDRHPYDPDPDNPDPADADFWDWWQRHSEGPGGAPDEGGDRT